MMAWKLLAGEEIKRQAGGAEIDLNSIRKLSTIFDEDVLYCET
jgi:hypothetical protein